MSSVNKVILVGRLGADPEMRHTQNGQPVCNLSVATSERWTGQDGQKNERTEWHRVSVFGKTAENCGRYLAKGRQVYIEGRIQSREYQDKDGNQRKAWEVVAQHVTFLAGGDNGHQAPRGQAPQQGGGWGQPAPQQQAPQAQGAWGQAPQQSAPQQGSDFTQDPIPF